MIEMVSDETFETQVVKSPKPVLVEFNADWCGPCKALQPVLEDIETRYAKHLKVVQVDVNENHRLVQDFKVRAYPTMLLMREGRVVEQIIGLSSGNELEQILKKNRIGKGK